MPEGGATTTELALLQRAIAIARRNFVPDPVTGVQRGGPFGAVVAYRNRILGSGGNSVTSTIDPTAHAEVNAIRAAAAAHGSAALKRAEVITSCEPCPMCLGAIEAAGVTRVVQAATRQMAARGGFDDAAFYAQLNLAPQLRDHPLLQLGFGSAHFLQTEAGHAALRPFGPIGAVMLRSREVVAVGRDETSQGTDPTAHSVVRAIQAAARALGTFDLTGCELVAAAPLNRMCVGASMWSRVDRTYYAPSAEVAQQVGLTAPSGVVETRSITRVQARAANAFAPFEEWLGRSGRVLY